MIDLKENYELRESISIFDFISWENWNWDNLQELLSKTLHDEYIKNSWYRDNPYYCTLDFKSGKKVRLKVEQKGQMGYTTIYYTFKSLISSINEQLDKLN